VTGLLEPHPDAIVWRSDTRRAVLSAILAGLLAIVALAAAVGVIGAVFAVMDMLSRIVTAFVLAAIAFACAALAQYVWRNARGFWQGWVAADEHGIAFSLPRDRSLVHRPAAIDGRLAWDAIARLETRLEAYRSQLMAMIQQTYWLVPNAGGRILLFEDRALNTPYAIRRGQAAFGKIAALGKVEIVEEQMVSGGGGLLGAWFTMAPTQAAANLNEQQKRTVWQRAGMTGRLGGMAVFVVLAAIVMQQLLG